MRILWFFLTLIVSLSALEGRELWPDQWLVGYGESIPGWGETEETVKSIDLVARWKIPVREYEPGAKILGLRSHEVWIESTFHRLVSDSDPVDDDDYGIVDLAFLAAFTFEKVGSAEPFIFVGGGPAYLFADIRGAGMDLTANYQTGFGIRNIPFVGGRLETLLKFHHISNMSLGDPNVSMNSLRWQVSLAY